MVAAVIGKLTWSGGRDDEGYRSYQTEAHVLTSSPLLGPAAVMQASGLPTVGSTWAVDYDIDVYAWCTPHMVVRPKFDEGEIDCNWVVTNHWQTKPRKRCSTQSVESPLNEPPKLSGSYIKWMEEATEDRNGDLLLMSSQERMKGPVVEVEKGRPQVQVALNVATLPLSDFSEQRGTLNNATLWGLPKRCVLLADITWERSLFGLCSFFYTINYSFEIKFETYNRFIVDEGTQKLWKPGVDPKKLGNYVKIRDEFDEPTSALLDGAGNPADKLSSVYVFEKELEKETNFLTLGIPTTL